MRPRHSCVHAHQVNIEIERAAKTLDQRHGAGVGRLPGEPCLLDQMRGDRAVDDTQHLPHDLWAGLGMLLSRLQRKLMQHSS